MQRAPLREIGLAIAITCASPAGTARAEEPEDDRLAVPPTTCADLIHRALSTTAKPVLGDRLRFRPPVGLDGGGSVAVGVRDSDSLDFGTGTLGIHVEVRELYRTVAASLDADVRNTDGSEIPAAESPIENVAAPGGGKAVRYRTRSSGGGDRVTAELVQGPDALLQLVTVGASDSARDALDQGDCAALEAKILATLEVGLRRLPRTAETRVLWSWGRAQLVVDLPRGTLLTRSRGYCGQACAGLSFSRDVVSYDVHIVAPNGQPRAVLAISADALDARGPYPLALRAPGAPAPVALPPGHVAGSVAACPARFDAKAPFTATGADDFDLVCELSVPAPEKPLLRIFGSAADAATLAPARSIASAVRLVILP